MSKVSSQTSGNDPAVPSPFEKFTSQNNPADSEPAWGTVNKRKLPRVSFAEEGEADKVTTWKLPHHWVKNGSAPDDQGRWTKGDFHLHRGGVAAAYAAIQGARIGKPMTVSERAKSHILAHRNYLMKQDKVAYLSEEKMILKTYGFRDEDIDEIYSLVEYDSATAVEVAKEHGIELAGVNTDHFVPIVKVDDVKGIVTGVVYSPDEIDAHGHFMTAPEIEKMAFRYMKAYKMGHAGIDYMHGGDDGSGILLESYIAPGDMTGEDGSILWKKGAWIITTEVHDKDILEKIKKGQITGYSMAGHAEFGRELPMNSGENLKSTVKKSTVQDDLNKPVNKVQSLLLLKSFFSNNSKVTEWCEKNGVDRKSIIDTPTAYRFKLEEATKYMPGSFRMIDFAKGIKALVGIPKK